jgi:branched-chain amino acid transport system substrate-binding protein
MIPIIDREKIVFVSSGASSPKLSGVSKYFFRTWPSDIAEALAMAKFAFENLSFRKAGILYINNEYGIGLKEPFANRFEDLGGKVIVAESFEQNATDFKAQIIKIKNLKTDFVYLAGNPREMARSIKQMRELGLRQQILGISTLNEKEVLEIAGKAIEGVMFTDVSYDPNSPTEETQKFIKDFETMFNRKPGILAITAYDALVVLKDAIEKNGLAPEKIANHLRNLNDFQGASGKISFDENGDVKRNVRIAIVKEGRFDTRLASFTW